MTQPAGAALLLHQYDTSPFSEKVRKVLAHKHLPWRSVEQPTIMPKPELLPLTGGYRRIPVLQIGADVWCDTQLIVREIERRHPTPTIFPGRSEGTCLAWGLWADRLVFLPTVAVVFAEIGQFMPQAFIEDRTKMMPGRNFADLPNLAPHAREQLRGLVATLDAQLADGRRWLLGTEFSLADAAVWHPLWFLRLAPAAPEVILGGFDHVRGWMERVDGLGQGQREPLPAADALGIARDATPEAGHGVTPGEPNGLVAGQAVTVTPEDYGFDPVAGTIVTATPDEIAVQRTDPAVGEIVVHFPRVGFRVAAA